MTKVYELYHCEYKGKVVYIGQGQKGRHKHCNSGISHVGALNEIYFSDGKDSLIVEVKATFETKQEVEWYEKLRICKLQPIFNTRRYDTVTTLIEETIDYFYNYANYIKVDKRKRFRYEQATYEDLIWEFIEFFGVDCFYDDSFDIDFNLDFNSLGYKYLGNLFQKVKFITNRCGVDTVDSYAVFVRATKDLFGIDLKGELQSV